MITNKKVLRRFDKRHSIPLCLKNRVLFVVMSVFENDSSSNPWLSFGGGPCNFSKLK